MQHLYFDSSFYVSEIESSGDGSTKIDKVIYRFLVPFLCFFGMWWNLLSLAIFIKNNYQASTYTYLCVIAGADFGNSLIIFMSSLCKGGLWESNVYKTYETIVALPLSSTLSFLGTIALVSVAFDRVIYLRQAKYNAKSHLCKRACARKAMLIAFTLAALINVPYSFFYTWEDGEAVPRDICFSEFFDIYNWIQFILGGVIPAILLIIANVMLMYTIKRIKQKRRKCNAHRSNAKRSTKNRQTFINVTLIGIIFLHLIGEFPTHLASMKTAATILYGGDKAAAKQSRDLLAFREVMMILNSLRLASNFIIYCLFCPDFRRNLVKLPLCKRLWRRKMNRKHARMKKREGKLKELDRGVIGVIKGRRKVRDRKVAVFVISERNKGRVKVKNGFSKINKY